MGKYIVITIAMSVRNNRIAEHGEIVDESQLNSPTHELVSGGFIRLATDEEIEAAGQVISEDDVSDNSEDDSEDLQDVIDESESKESKQDISKKDAVKNGLKNK